MASSQRCGFTDGGTRYVVRDVHLIDRADGDLWNDSMTLQIDQRGRVWQSGFLQPNLTPYSERLRCFYVKDEESGEFWSAPFEPVQRDPDTFEFSIGLADLRWTVRVDGIRSDLRVVIPRDDRVEIWSAAFTNETRRARRLSIYSFMPCGLLGLLAQNARFDRALNGGLLEYFPYYVHYQDYDRLEKLANCVFCSSDVRPDAHELSIADFVGRHELHNPDQVRAPRLSGKAHGAYDFANERTAFVMQYRRRLRAGARFGLHLVFGPAHGRFEARRLALKYGSGARIERALQESLAFLSAHGPAVRVRTPDTEFNHYVNHWLPRRSLMLARTIRHNYAPQGRNVIQDAMGGAYTDPSSSRGWFLKIWAHQHRNGWLPHGMPFAEGVQQVPINSIPHKDINSWGPTALAFYMNETGDDAILDERIRFADEPAVDATLYDHIGLGLDWLLRDRTRRALSRIGQGDWNDPLNMAGLAEKGESVWLTEALVYALATWAEVAERRGDRRRAARYRREAARSRRAINRHAWDGAWYARGFTDAGKPFGVKTDTQGRIFLNAQSWAIICGAADVRRAASCIRSVERMLMAPAGAMKLWPPFSGMRKEIGKLTQKVPGWNENGSVYCHASTFYACALFVAREADKGFDALRRLLPGYGRNTIRRTGQVPLYLPNFYRGETAGRKAGLSSHAPNTGTASWYYRAVVAMLLGVRGEAKGLRIDPQLPKAWKRVTVWRRWRGAEFDIEIVRARGRGRPRVAVTLDGRAIRGNLIPAQAPKSRHAVRVLVR